jgi:ribosomal protein S12 methylthiotransferase
METESMNEKAMNAKTIPKIGFVSLGCPKNTFDSERILTQLRAEGYLIVPTYQDADLVVVNTCGFIDSAVEESLDAIGEALRENGKVLVTGCLGARADVIMDAHPQVLAITGPHADKEVMRHVHAHLAKPHDPFADLIPPGGLKLTPRHYAYLKISEGCNHRCTFCIIPSMRRPGLAADRRCAEGSRSAGQGRGQGIADNLSGYKRLRR